MQPVIVEDRDTGGRALRVMRWGLIPGWCKDLKSLGLSTINAKAETLMQKPMWKTPFRKRRCLVPADGFYEWKKLDVKTKQSYAFALKSEEPLAFGGLWERWKAPDGQLEWATYNHHHRPQRTRLHGAQSNAADPQAPGLQPMASV